MAQKKATWRTGVSIVRDSFVNSDERRHERGRHGNHSGDHKFVSGVNIIRAFLNNERLNAGALKSPDSRRTHDTKHVRQMSIPEKDKGSDSDEAPVNQPCSFFFSEIGCKYGNECRFSHSQQGYDYEDDGEGDEENGGGESPVQICPFLAVGCRFGPRTCRYLHPADPTEEPQSSASATPAQSPLTSPVWRSPRAEAPPFIPSSAPSENGTIATLVPMQATRPLAVVLKQKSITSATFSTTHTITTYASSSTTRTTKRSLVFSEFVPSGSPTSSSSSVDFSETLMSTSSSPVASSPSSSLEASSDSGENISTPSGECTSTPARRRLSAKELLDDDEVVSVKRERKLSERATPSNEPWVPKWKQDRERKLSEKQEDTRKEPLRDEANATTPTASLTATTDTTPATASLTATDTDTTPATASLTATATTAINTTSNTASIDTATDTSQSVTATATAIIDTATNAASHTAASSSSSTTGVDELIKLAPETQPPLGGEGSNAREEETRIHLGV